MGLHPHRAEYTALSALPRERVFRTAVLPPLGRRKEEGKGAVVCPSPQLRFTASVKGVLSCEMHFKDSRERRIHLILHSTQHTSQPRAPPTFDPKLPDNLAGKVAESPPVPGTRRLTWAVQG